MYKYIGISVLILISSYTGHLFSCDYKKRKDSLGMFIRLLEHIKSETFLYCIPLCDIFAKYADSDHTDFQNAVNNEGISALLRYSEHLAAKERSLIYELTKALGNMSADDQIKACENALIILRDSYMKAERELPANCKMCDSLGFMGGVLIAIILI